MANVYEKLCKVQSGLKAPKGQFNKFGGYAYRSCEDITEAVKPLLAAEKASLIVTDNIEMVGNRTYVKATACFIDTQDGASVSVSAFAREAEIKKGMDESQITGSASSYARKYALNGLFAIDDTKDADATNDHGKAAPAKPTMTAEENPFDEPIICECCGKQVTSTKAKDGSTITAKKMASLAFQKTGKTLCGDCLKNELTKGN